MGKAVNRMEGVKRESVREQTGKIKRSERERDKKRVKKEMLKGVKAMLISGIPC